MDHSPTELETSFPPQSWLIVIGTSSSENRSLGQLLSVIPESSLSTILIVKHIASTSSAAIIAAGLQLYGDWICEVAQDGRPLMAGHVIIAPADHHLMVMDGNLLVRRGARENQWRPSIDVLFRSAAASHRNQVIGILLGGLLDDGVAGLDAIKRCGGITIVQDLTEAEPPDLPLNALDRVAIDHCLPLRQLGEMITRLTAEPPGLRSDPAGIPADIAMEAKLSTRVAGGPDDLDRWGTPTSVTCPECGGELWISPEGGDPHFRCHTGHAYGPLTLMAAQKHKIEDTLWAALRMFQERRRLVDTAARTPGIRWDGLEDQQREAAEHIHLLHKLLHIPWSSERATPESEDF